MNFHQFLRHYLMALQSFTRLPLAGTTASWPDFVPDGAPAGTVHFPGVGLLVAVAACLVFAVVSLGLPDTALSPLVAAAFSTAATAILTGAAHERGLAATADGLGANVDRDQALAIMADVRVGALGALALLLVVGAKLALLAVLAVHSAAGVIVTLLAGHAVSRFWPLALMHSMAHVGGDEGRAPWAGTLDRRGLAFAGLWCAAPLLLMIASGGWPFLILALALSAAALFGLRAWFRHHLQGFNGACLGAAQQVCEVSFYLGAAFGLGR